jgi:hypothetical protein
MKQTTPLSWGQVFWGGGAGRPGEMGGWRFKCAFCNVGNSLFAIARQPLADRKLSQHVLEKHRGRAAVQNLLEAKKLEL